SMRGRPRAVRARSVPESADATSAQPVVGTEGKVCRRRRNLGSPDAGVGRGNQRPEMVDTVLDRFDLIENICESDEFVRAETTCCVAPSHRVAEAHGDRPRAPDARARCVHILGKGAFVDLEWIPQTRIEEKPEPPGTPSG